METVLISIICIALIVFGGMTMSQGFMTSVDTSTMSLSEIGQNSEIMTRTELTPISANTTLISGPDPLDIVLRNTGQVKIADFADWDVIVQYYSDTGNYTVKYLPYSSNGSGTNVWGVNWIHFNGQSETFEPNVLNPGEDINIRTWLDPSVGTGTTNMVVISTPSGITCSTYFTP
jgi:hypothetical protein